MVLLFVPKFISEAFPFYFVSNEFGGTGTVKSLLYIFP